MIQGHGGNVRSLATRLGCPVDAITDMSSNINPLGSPPGLLEHLAGHIACIQSLPEVDARTAAQSLAQLLAADPERVLLGPGTTQFIYTACAALQSERVLILGPTYADYHDGCRLHGIVPDFLLAEEKAGFQPNVQQLAQALATGYDTVFCCNPNNPTGQSIPSQGLLDLCHEYPQTRFIVDASYEPFATPELDRKLTGARLPNLLMLWSVSKIFAMPGLRTGALMAEPQLLEHFLPFMQPWSVNSLAQEALFFLGQHLATIQVFIRDTHAFLVQEGNLLRQRLSGSGLTLFPSQTSYFLIKLPAGTTAAQVCTQLADQKILIRNCANFRGLDERFVRIALKDPDSNERAARLLKDAMPNCGSTP